MADQNFKNHSRFVPMFHFVAFTAALFAWVMALVNFFKAIANESGRLNAAAMVALSAALILGLWYSRVFALKAQDRAIRAEENFRHFLASGKSLDSRLRMGQIIALRFASDDEFVSLSKQAVDENLDAKQIKMAIKNWKVDNNRA
ncbi:MAG: DUF6526 family protein [Ferruginibacter sp.]